MAEMYRTYQNDEHKAKVYSRRLMQAEEANKKWHPQVKKYVERYDAVKQATQLTGDGHHVGVPAPIAIVDSLYASMTATEVDLVVSSRGAGSDDQAYVATEALSYEWERCKVNRRSNKSVKDSLLGGLGWVKVGYEYYESEEELPRWQEDIDREVRAMFAQAEEAGGKNIPTADEIMRAVPITEVVNTVLKDRVVVDYVPWDMVLWDPTAKNIEDVGWVAQKSYMTPEEVKQDPLFKEYCASRRTTRKLKDVKADTTINPDVIGDNRTPEDEEDRCTLYTVWDFGTGTACTFQKNADFILNEAPNPFAINDDPEDKSPFVALILRDTPSRVRGVSTMEVLQATNLELDLYHSKLGTYLERMAPKVLAEARAFSPAGKKAMRSQEIGAVVELEEGHTVAEVTDLKVPTLMSEMYAMPDKLEQAMREASGVNELMRGLFPDRKRTATETSEVVTASSARQAEARTALERFYLDIARRILQLMQMFYTKDRVMRLTDEAGDIPWEWNADDIAFEFDLDIALTPKEAQSWQTRSDRALANLNVLGPFAQPGPDGSSPVNITELLRYTMQELNMPRKVMHKVLSLPEDQQRQAMGALQTQAAQAQAAQGVVPSPAGVPGPLDAGALAAAANQGTIPPELLAAAQGPGTPGSPQAVERVSEDVGVAGL
jgi:hypothetical protein